MLCRAEGPERTSTQISTPSAKHRHKTGRERWTSAQRRTATFVPRWVAGVAFVRNERVFRAMTRFDEPDALLRWTTPSRTD
jgi:hypothetical protein